MKTVADVLAAFELAALNAGLARNTRKTYAATIREFTELLKAGKIAGPQDYFHHLASVKKLSPGSVHHALNPLKFLYEQVLKKEFGTDYELPKRNRCKPMRSVLSMQDILSMMETMERIPRLQTGLLAGCGLRIESDMLTLRLKDIRLDDPRNHRALSPHHGRKNRSQPARYRRRTRHPVSQIRLILQYPQPLKS